MSDMHEMLLPAVKKPLMAPPHATHPFKHETNHKKLLEYLKQRIDFAATTRDALIPRYEAIDKDVAGYLELSDDDKKRRVEELQGKGPTVTTMNLPLVLLHLDDALTYFMNVFAPESGMFQAVAKKDEIQIANAFAALMNSHALERSYFRQLLKFLFDCMKYNLGGIETVWEQEYGNAIKNDEGRGPKIVQDILWEGNDFKSLDMYNTMWDPSTHPIDVHSKGEYVITVKMITQYKLRRLIQDGVIQNADALMDNAQTARVESWYHTPPQLFDARSLGVNDKPGGNINWLALLSEGTFNQLGSGIEFAHVYIHIVPTQFGLIPASEKGRDRLETWRITIANGIKIVSAVHMPNAHGKLPFNFASPMEDNLGLAQKSIAEILAPLQSFGSFLVNTHTAATRKNIWDLIIYDPTVIPLEKLGKGDVAGRIPVNAAGYGKDIHQSIWQNTNQMDTKDTMGQLKQVIELMQLLWPTSAMPNQIAQMDRAVEAQVTTTVQSANRRLQKAAKLIDDQALRPSRFIMHWNILQFQQKMTLLTPDGQTVEIDPAQFREANIKLLVGAGLQSIDRQIVQMQIQRLVNSIIQNQEAAVQFDLPALLNMLSDMMDIRVDLTQFRRVQPQIPGQVPGAPPAGQAQEA